MVPCIGTVSASPLAAARRPSAGPRAGRLRPRRHRRRGRRRGRPGSDDLEPLAADLDGDRLALARLVGRRPARRRTARCCCRTRSRSSGCGRANVVRRAMNAGSSTTARWNGSTVGMPVDHELGQRAARALQRLRRGRAGDDQLGDQRVERAGHGLAGLVAAVQRARPDRDGGAPRGQRARGGQEAAPGVLGVDPELDRVAARPPGRRSRAPRRRRCGTSRAPGRCPVTSSVTGCSTCRRVLTSRNEIVPSWPTRNSQVPGADVAGLAQDRLGRRRTAVATCSSVRNGAGASSTSFWWRRCSEQSRVETTTTLPCGVGQALGLDVPRPVEVALDEALAAAERGDRLADGATRTARGSPRSVRATFRPRPPPPNAALIAIGRPCSSANATHLVGAGDRVRRARRPAARRPSGRCAGPGPCRRARRSPPAAGRSRSARRRSRPGRSRRSRPGSRSPGAPRRRRSGAATSRILSMSR